MYGGTLYKYYDLIMGYVSEVEEEEGGMLSILCS